MESLKKFKKKQTNKHCVLLIVAFFIILSILIGKTYAVYQREIDVTFINAKVRWPYANEVVYTTTSNENVSNVSEALNDLYDKLGE